MGMNPSAVHARSPLRLRQGRSLSGVLLRASWREPVSRARCRGQALVVRANLLKYLSEAAARIFSVPDDQPIDWEKTYLPFEGRITRRDRMRLDKLVDVVAAVKGCTDPSAMNYDPSANLDDGTCSYTEATGPESASMGTYLGYAVERVFGHQFTADGNEPEFPIVPFTGEINSQREIEKMLTFEKVVKKTIEESEEEAKVD